MIPGTTTMTNGSPLPLHDVAPPEAHTGVKGGEPNLSPLVHQEFTQV